MWDFNDVVAIRYLKDYVFHVRFDNGLEGDVNFAEYLDGGPVFASLKDLAFFQKATIAGGTIAWPNGADIAPETLYEKTLLASRSFQPAATG